MQSCGSEGKKPKFNTEGEDKLAEGLHIMGRQGSSVNQRPYSLLVIVSIIVTLIVFIRSLRFNNTDPFLGSFSR